ncbi:MAG TPA: hypothetical protein VGP33_18425, partial [Chloroflexota bacterium]|nr:hypothetical protein [Chloroflexota bacterium]
MSERFTFAWLQPLQQQAQALTGPATDPFTPVWRDRCAPSGYGHGEPHAGRVDAPRCGSGGMFVRAETFVRAHAARSATSRSARSAAPPPPRVTRDVLCLAALRALQAG